MAIAAGTKLGPYEILGPLGAGGMGEVYRARDARVDRVVALKVLSEEFFESEERRSRFEREARMLASLNHPGIATLYSFEEIPGSFASSSSASTRHLLVMELVEGRTLRELLGEGPLPAKRILVIGAQIADALARAHAAGIVHRDLKPENVMVSRDGLVKILDFGLAKAAPLTDLESRAETDARLTTPGVIVGTASYMSPEQAAGRPLDFRSDQFSLGSILWEMASGKSAFRRDTAAETLAAILRAEPQPVADLRPELPAVFGWIVERCLAKDAEERYASTRDLARDLAAIRDRGSGASPAAPAPRVRNRRELLAWSLAVVASVAALVAGLRGARPRGSSAAIIRASLEIPIQPILGAQALSPDGTRLVYVGSGAGPGPQLWVRFLDALAPQPLAGTDGARMPFWSPDGRVIGFFADGKLKKIDASGGPATTLCNAPDPRGGSWGPDGTILFAPTYRGGVSRVPSAGGEPVSVTRTEAPSEFSHRWPRFLPDGRHFLAVVLITDPAIGTQTNALSVGSLDSGGLKTLVRDASNAMYVSPGWLIYARDSRLVAHRFDTAQLRLVGEPVPVTAPAAMSRKRWAYSEFSVSGNGVLLCRPSIAPRTQLTWLDRDGRRLGTVGEPGFHRSPRISPDGRSVALVRFDPANEEGDVWLLDLERGVSSRFTNRAAYYGDLVWSPDGRSLAFDSNLAGVEDLYRKDVKGGDVVPVLKTALWKSLSDWSRDGRHLLFSSQDPVTGMDMWAVAADGKDPFAVLKTPFWEHASLISPDGRYVVYRSDASGRFELYARPFPGPGEAVQVSRNGADSARWSRGGNELFFLEGGRRLEAVEIRTAPSLRVGEPRPLFEVRDVNEFDVAPDGRFLVAVPADRAGESVTLVINWTRELER